jgi:predicted ArsR family transcriptional regulator
MMQKEAAAELGVTERHVRRLLQQLQRRGDQALVHALRGAQIRIRPLRMPMATASARVEALSLLRMDAT